MTKRDIPHCIKKEGPTEIRTQVKGIRILCDNQLHYRTVGPFQIEPGKLSIVNSNHTPRPSTLANFK